MQLTLVPSDPVQLRSDRAARQLSRIGSASIASKLDDQLQLAGGVVEASLVAASLDSAWVLPPHAARQVRARTDVSRRERMLEDYATAAAYRQCVAPCATSRPASTDRALVGWANEGATRPSLIRHDIHVIRSAAGAARKRTCSAGATKS